MESVSVIITCYNSANTIRRTINSVINQTYKDIEIIIVNDCSTDNSLDVIKSIKDDRIKIINHELNKGAGLARRTGLNNITGSYTMFLDSDDYLKSDCIETLIKYTIEYDADVVAPGYIPTKSNGDVMQILLPDLNVQQGVNKYNHDSSDTKRFMNPMLIKSSIWDNVEYSSRRFIEDTPTLFKVLYYANKVVTVPYAGYYYTQNENSLIHSATSFKYKLYLALCAKDIYMFTKDKEMFQDTKPLCVLRLRELFNNDYSVDDYNQYKDECTELLFFISELKLF